EGSPPDGRQRDRDPADRVRLLRRPALLRAGHRDVGTEGLTDRAPRLAAPAPATLDSRLMRAGSTIHGWLLAGLIVGHSPLGVWHGLAAPLWEAPDEPAHYQSAWFLAPERRFPSEMIPLLSAAPDETPQPPLYYVAGALLIPLLGPEPVLIR